MKDFLTFDGNFLENKLKLLAQSSMQACGLWRASYTKEDLVAKEILKGWFTENGFISVYTDPVGNQYGCLRSRQGQSGTILVGSHLDTVKNGGMYDGAAGILLGIYAVSALLQYLGPPKRNVEVAAFVEEEGSRFLTASYLGSRAVNGLMSSGDLTAADESGVTLKCAAAAAGYPIQNFSEAVRDDLLYYIEPHIEQGSVLERSNTQVGIVEAITGFTLLTVNISGRADHAGTTYMPVRRDALLTAARIISQLPGLVSKESLSDTITVGSISVKPGNSNVVPQSASFTIDIRSTDMERLNRMCAEATGLCESEAGNSQCTAQVQCDLQIRPVTLNKELSRTIEACCSELDLTCKHMISGAGHDCMHFAGRIPSAMFFLPSRGGRSHCPEEYTSPEQLSYGTALLARLLYELAWK